MKNKTNLKSVIIGIIVLIAILIIGSYTGIEYFENNAGNKTNLYENIEIYRTDEDNLIWLTSDGQSIHIKTLNYNMDGANRKISYEFIFRHELLKCAWF